MNRFLVFSKSGQLQ